MNINALAMWARKYGWDVIEPRTDVIRSNMKFWENIWQTGLIESDFYENQGISKNVDFS